MHIKVLRGRVCGVRTTYLPERGRGAGTQVIAFPSWLTSLEQVRLHDPKQKAQVDALRPGERDQLEEWLQKREVDRARIANQQSLRVLDRQLDSSLLALDNTDCQDSLTPELAESLYRKVRRLQQAMKKLGHARPKAD